MGPELYFFGIIGIQFTALLVLVIADSGKSKPAE